MATDTLYASGDLASWYGLGEAERAFYAGVPLAADIIEHVCRYWSQTAEHETFFEDASLIPD